MDDMVVIRDKSTSNSSLVQNNTSLGITSCLSDSHLDKMRDPAEDEDDETPIPTGPKSGLKVLFLSSDTGGGHRASAESLGKQFQLLFPGSTYDLIDMVEKDGGPPNSSLVSMYKHLSNRPGQWKLVYNVTNIRAFEVLADAHLKLMWERSVRRRIKAYNPDVVVSVHPMMTNVPVLACSKISAETGRHLPIFTVVTDLGSAHCLWFANGVEKMFVGSDAIKELAKARGKVPDEKLILAGLPIRHDFAVQAELLSDRYSVQGKEYQRKIRRELQLPPMENGSCDRATLLLMGGGEGVGSLENITDALYVELASQGIDALILVVCGRNEKLKSWIDGRDWDSVHKKWQSIRNRDSNGGGASSRATTLMSRMTLPHTCGGGGGAIDQMTASASAAGCIESPVDVTGRIRAIISMGTRTVENAMAFPSMKSPFASPKNDAANGIENSSKDVPTLQLDKCSDSSIDGVDEPSTVEGPESNAAVTVLPLNSSESIDEADILREEVKCAKSTTNESGDELTNKMTADLESRKEQSDVGTTILNVDTYLDSSSIHLPDDFMGSETRLGNVTVKGLGFVNQMAEYMVATDILITKAGPGTISEAAAVSLPVMLTSFLPGQEEGNIDYVINAGFGGYCDVSDPMLIAEEVCMWLQDETKMKQMSENAKNYGKPYAARDIAKSIGESTLRWLEHNQEVIEEQERLKNIIPHSTSSLSVDDVVILTTDSSA